MDRHADLAFVMLGPDLERDSTASGKSASPSSPTPVICFHGSGNSSHYDIWLPLLKKISTFSRVVFYERRGVRGSPSTDSRSQTPLEAIADLADLLQHLALKPPYVLVAHSYGGTFAREFLQQDPGQVAGLVLAETGQETPTKHDEEQYRNRILSNKPLSVIHADSLHGKREGTTSAAGLDLLRRWAEEDERLKKAQLRLSSNARYVRVDGCGHDVVRHRPDVVCEEVEWVLGNLKTVQRQDGLRRLGERLKAYISCLRRR